MTMIIYTTLKENRKNNVNFVQFVEECITPIGYLFGKEYIDEYDYSDLDKIYEDFTTRQIESTVIKFIKEDAKDKEDGCFFKHKNVFIDREFAYDDCVDGVKRGIFKASDIHEINKKSKKFGFKIKKESWNENDEWHTYYANDIIDEYFPCNFDIHNECTNCRNCD